MRPTHALLTLAVLAASSPILAQEDVQVPDQQTRQLWDTTFVSQRPHGPKPVRTPRPRASSSVKPGPFKPPESTDWFVGITLWRLRRAGPGEASVSIDIGGVGRWVPERMPIGGPVAEGQHVRLSIEVSRPGFLYVIDRERYRDGTLGEPWLIFPTRRVRGGDNRVGPGRVIEIPDLGDTPPVFTLRRSRPDHAGELLTVIVSPEPLPVPLERSAIKLPVHEVQSWERVWSTPVQKLEMAGGAGRAYSAAEYEAGRSATRLLTQEEPLPQTLYRLEATARKPTMLKLPLPVE
jgi:Domain of unknown function (DUF4384)